MPDFIKIDEAQEQTAGFFKVIEGPSYAATTPTADPGFQILELSSAELAALAAARRWVDGKACDAYVRPSPRAVESETDSRVIIRFKVASTIITGTQKLDVGDPTPTLTLEVVDSHTSGTRDTGVTVSEYPFTVDDSRGDRLFRINVTAGLSSINVNTSEAREVYLRGTDAYVISEENGYQLHFIIYDTEL